MLFEEIDCTITELCAIFPKPTVRRWISVFWGLRVVGLGVGALLAVFEGVGLFSKEFA